MNTNEKFGNAFANCAPLTKKVVINFLEYGFDAEVAVERLRQAVAAGCPNGIINEYCYYADNEEFIAENIKEVFQLMEDLDYHLLVGNHKGANTFSVDSVASFVVEFCIGDFFCWFDEE